MKIKQISKKMYKMMMSLLKQYGLEADLPKTKNVKAIETKHGELIYVNNEPVLVCSWDIPTFYRKSR